MQLTTAVSVLLATVFGALAAVHVYWAFAAKGASLTFVPMSSDDAPLFRPGRIATLSVAVALMAAALTVLGAGNVVTLIERPLWYRIACWTLGLVMLLRAIGDFRYVGFFKTRKSGRFAAMDSRWYSPLCAVLATGCGYLASR
jgi:Protein of unknown function (DUF3995)